MPRRHKPKWGWNESGFYSFRYLSDEDYQQIAKVLGIPKIPKEIRSELQNAIRDYFLDKDYITEIPRPGEVKAALLVLQRKAKKVINCPKEHERSQKAKELMDCLKNLDNKTQQLLWLVGFRTGSLWSQKEQLQELTKQIAREVFKKRGVEASEDLFRKPDFCKGADINKLYTATERALEMLEPDKGGRPKERAALKGFINE